MNTQFSGKSPAFPRSWFRRALAWTAWGYLLLVILVWAFMFWAGDRWWGATLVLFGPRWLCLLPLTLLVPLALIFRRRSLWLLLTAAIVALGPLGGFCIPWARFLVHGSPTIRVLTCNTKGHCYDNDQLDALIRESNPDIVALQGCWNDVHVQWPDAWHVLRSGELLVASRFPLQEVTATSHTRTGYSQPRENLLSCIVRLPEGELRFATVHLQSPHLGIARLLDRRTGIRPSRSDLIVEEINARWHESEEVASQLVADGLPDIVVGDLNLPVESPIYRTFWSSWFNAFSAAGWGFGNTEWPEGTAGIRFGIRIDHILGSPRWRPKCCWLGPDVDSDHLPLVADMCRE